MGKHYSVGGMFYPAWQGCYTRYKWKGPFRTGELNRAFCSSNRTKNYSVFLVTVHDPICTQSGNLEAALFGSFLPIPSDDMFPVLDPSEYSLEKLPGAIIAKRERIPINKGRERVRIRVTNNGDRPIQVRASEMIIQTILETLPSDRLPLPFYRNKLIPLIRP